MSSEKDIIEAERRSLREQDRFFSNSAKAERELWVTREFLVRLGVPFADGELKVQTVNSDVDVVFREARFQIKEITDPGERRHAEIKASLRRAERAVTLQDLIEPAEARDTLLADLHSLILAIASSPKYPPGVRATLDLLCYVTRPYAGFNEPEGSKYDELEASGWRSISCLLGQRPYVLAATVSAPDFLLQGWNRRVRRPTPGLQWTETA